MISDVKDQVAPCGITCGTCDLGSGAAAYSAKKTIELIKGIGIKDWAPMVPGGEELSLQGPSEQKEENQIEH